MVLILLKLKKVLFFNRVKIHRMLQNILKGEYEYKVLYNVKEKWRVADNLHWKWELLKPSGLNPAAWAHTNIHPVTVGYLSSESLLQIVQQERKKKSKLLYIYWKRRKKGSICWQGYSPFTDTASVRYNCAPITWKNVSYWGFSWPRERELGKQHKGLLSHTF